MRDFVGIQCLKLSLNVLCCVSFFICATNAADTEPLAISTVGMAGRIDDLVLPGAKLQAKPMTDRHQPFVLRVIEVYPHGTDHRYNLEFYALEPGEYNVSEYLVRAEDSAANDPANQDGVTALPPTMVRIDATLPPGQVAPLPLSEPRTPWLGGYRLLWIAGGVLWLIGLYGLLFYGRKKNATSTQSVTQSLSLADQLRPLVQAARDKRLSPEQQAVLERTLIAYWCRRLNLGSTAPAQVMQILRAHAEAGPLVRSLEDWLHRPDPSQTVDIEALLEPYANVTEIEIAEPDTAIDKLGQKQGVAAS